MDVPEPAGQDDVTNNEIGDGRARKDDDDDYYEDSDEGDEDDDSLPLWLDRVERDEQTDEIVAYRLENEFVPAEEECVIRRYSTVMVQADPGEHKYIGYIRGFEQNGRRLAAHVGWFYRFHDLEGHVRDLVSRKARLSKVKGGGDRGRYKELCFSDHQQEVDVDTIMHPVRVWCIPDMSLAPVTLPRPGATPSSSAPGSAAAAAAGAAGPASGSGRVRAPSPSRGGPEPSLLPGFVCRRIILTQRNHAFMKLGEVAKKGARKGLSQGLVDEVVDMLRLSREEREEFAAEWQRRSEERQRRAAAAAAAAPAAAAAAAAAAK